MTFRRISFLLALVIVALSSCRKEKLLTSGGELKFSVDTLAFDTVFAEQASFTQEFKVYNPLGQKVNISSVRLEKGDQSLFHINVNGVSGSNVQDVDLAANDSMYIFATVNIVDPQNRNNPFIVTDRVIFNLNGKDYYVPLTAYGQNAYYIVNQRLETQTWKTDKPYVVVRSAQVDSSQTLTIPAGCRVYMHGDSRLFVYGTLKILGTQTDSVIFQGDRLDRGYFANKDFAGEWGGLYFWSSSTNNVIDHAVIKNAGNTAFGAVAAAIQINPAASPDLQLDIRNTRIENSLGHGVLAFGSIFTMNNCLVHTCGAQALAVIEGGAFDINNCTFALYSTGGINGLKHTDNPAVALLNYRDIDNVNYIGSNLNGLIRNSIIWGGLETEVVCSKKGTGTYSMEFRDCIYKSKDELPDFVTRGNTYRNADPLFENTDKWNYRLKAGSAAIDKGVLYPGINERDMEDKPRNGNVDLGCYEY